LALGLLTRHLGELITARDHLEQAMALYDRQGHRALALRHGRDPGVSSRNFLILTLWLLGYPDQALQRSHDAITLAQELAHPYSLVLALSFAARHAHLLRREVRAAQERAEAAIALCTAQGFAQWTSASKWPKVSGLS
jgi:adenylate cyclase